MNRPLSLPSPRKAGRGVPIWFMAPIHVRFLEVFVTHEPPIGARTAMSARIKSKELADKAVRAPFRRRLMAPTHVQILEVLALHEPDFGRDIALRCPRPRSRGRHRCAAQRGADSAARRPYQVRGSKRENSRGILSPLVPRGERGKNALGVFHAGYARVRKRIPPSAKVV